jgi:hypothetical protein
LTVSPSAAAKLPSDILPPMSSESPSATTASSNSKTARSPFVIRTVKPKLTSSLPWRPKSSFAAFYSMSCPAASKRSATSASSALSSDSNSNRSELAWLFQPAPKTHGLSPFQATTRPTNQAPSSSAAPSANGPCNWPKNCRATSSLPVLLGPFGPLDRDWRWRL